MIKLIKNEYDALKVKIDSLLAKKDELDAATIDLGVANYYLHYIVGEKGHKGISEAWPMDVSWLAHALESLIIEDKCIDPFDPSNHNIPIWCVMGQNGGASLVAIKIRREKLSGLVAWLYNTYGTVHGFKNAGERLDRFLIGGRSRKLRFYKNIDDALAKIKELASPEANDQ